VQRPARHHRREAVSHRSRRRQHRRFRRLEARAEARSEGDRRQDERQEEVQLVGVAGFEPAAPCPPDKCATRLRHTPNAQSLPHPPLHHACTNPFSTPEIGTFSPERPGSWTPSIHKAPHPRQPRRTDLASAVCVLWGTRGPEFKSQRPDHGKALLKRGFLFSGFRRHRFPRWPQSAQTSRAPSWRGRSSRAKGGRRCGQSAPQTCP
jgi:hypothetical protein